MVSLVSNLVWFLRFSRELGIFSVFRRSCLFNTNDKSKYCPNIFLPGQPYTVLPLFGITYRFWRLQLIANFPKVPSNITIPIAELSSPTREICRPTTSHLMMQQLELHLEEAIHAGDFFNLSGQHVPWGRDRHKNFWTEFLGL